MIVTPPRHLQLAALILLLSIGATACDGCNKTEEKPPEPPKAPEVKLPDELPPPEDPLKEAREDAEKQANDLALIITDTVALVGADIEGMLNQPTPPANRPTTRIKQVETGNINAADAAAVFKKYDLEMQRCYERALKKNPGLAGRVNLTLIVNIDGKVRSSSARSNEMDNKEVFNCMERLAADMAFPKPDGGAARLSKPYTFNPMM
jgi:hypothetical protein